VTDLIVRPLGAGLYWSNLRYSVIDVKKENLKYFSFDKKRLSRII